MSSFHPPITPSTPLSPHDVAIRRQDISNAYSLHLISLLPSPIATFTSANSSPSTPLSALTISTQPLLRLLSKIHAETLVSPELTFELASDGLHALLTKLSKLCSRLEEEVS